MSTDQDALQYPVRPPGTVLNGKWTLEALLGAGGMATVYRARHRNGRQAAVKILHPEISADRGIRKRFLREGYVANTVNHPGAVRVEDDDIAEDGSAYLVMELLEGETIQSVWERQGPKLESSWVLGVAGPLLDILITAHSAGVVHRDLKPDNLFITSTGELKVLDFGIAQLRDPSGSNHVTTMGTVMGAPAFMAPEQAWGHYDRVDARTDLWSVGAVLFSLLTGRHVHQGVDPIETWGLARKVPAPPLRSIEPAVPEVVASVVDRALAFEQESRFPDASAMQQAVWAAQQALLSGGHGAGVQPRQPMGHGAEAGHLPLSGCAVQPDASGSAGMGSTWVVQPMADPAAGGEGSAALGGPPLVKSASTAPPLSHSVHESRGRGGRRVGWLVGAGIAEAAAVLIVAGWLFFGEGLPSTASSREAPDPSASALPAAVSVARHVTLPAPATPRVAPDLTNASVLTERRDGPDLTNASAPAEPRVDLGSANPSGSGKPPESTPGIKPSRNPPKPRGAPRQGPPKPPASSKASAQAPAVDPLAIQY